MQHNERDRDPGMDNERVIGSDESVRDRGRDLDAELQRDGNLGNERTRTPSDRDPATDDDRRMSER